MTKLEMINELMNYVDGGTPRFLENCRQRAMKKEKKFIEEAYSNFFEAQTIRAKGIILGTLVDGFIVIKDI